MADIAFPAHITVHREHDVDGLPILTAEVTLPDDVADMPLPAGPPGSPGRLGRPRTTFQKMGEIADSGSRPAGLGPEDRGKWWHRLDDDGMDVWTGNQWRHSPSAVGPQGPVAAAAQIVGIETVHDEKLTNPAVEFIGAGGQSRLRVTVPAGLQGPKGPPGESGTITEADDYDKSIAPMPGGVFAFHSAGRKFRSAPPPLGAGPWSWYETDFSEDQQANTSRLTVGTFTVPAQPFAWRPRVSGHIYQYSPFGGGAMAMVRLHHSEGEVLATTSPSGGDWLYLPLIPSYGEGRATKTLAPNSTFAAVPAGQPANLVVLIERLADSGDIAFDNARASLVVHAHPIGAS
ncbi:hypothetical protein JK358_00915 [Nocardia sp. 2]|uniref:Uncharacterized protein n=1 Tax=Nocardia acididurans TaxID=2802282 RepID=A0ABS1LXU2_9NOCA|nr:hypothetical protein [Nocardia acididurans]MBL1072950.1 hypothetical protein [Nocardia acididurans]